MKQLTKELFATMTPPEIETFLNEMFEAYLDRYGMMQTNLKECHRVKTLLIDITRKIYNN